MCFTGLAVVLGDTLAIVGEVCSDVFVGEVGECPVGGGLVGALAGEQGDGAGGEGRVERDGGEVRVLVGDRVGEHGGQRGVSNDFGECVNGVGFHGDSGCVAALGEVGVDMAAGGEIGGEQG